jgi:hypothetical protein
VSISRFSTPAASSRFTYTVTVGLGMHGCSASSAGYGGRVDLRHISLAPNVRAVDVKLTSQDLARLDALTRPTFGFPQSMQPIFPSIHNGGTSVNGVQMPPSPFVMEKGGTPY